MLAYTADKREKLLEIQTGLRGGMGPPITYMLDGKQYVALNGGTGQAGGGGRGAAPAPGAAPAGPAPQAPAGQAANPAPAPPAAANAAPAATPIRPKLLVFVLDGKGELPITK
jgi:hypothetical protein